MGPCPELTEKEESIFSDYVLPVFMDEMVRRLGRNIIKGF
jgi:hypothetical protein